MTLQDWGILAGIVTGIGSVFAVPFGVWMAKVYSRLNLIGVQQEYADDRITSLETHRDSMAEIRQMVASRQTDQMGMQNDRINEHAERLAGHETRIKTNESEIGELRTRQHELLIHKRAGA